LLKDGVSQPCCKIIFKDKTKKIFYSNFKVHYLICYVYLQNEVKIKFFGSKLNTSNDLNSFLKKLQMIRSDKIIFIQKREIKSNERDK